MKSFTSTLKCPICREYFGNSINRIETYRCLEQGSGGDLKGGGRRAPFGRFFSEPKPKLEGLKSRFFKLLGVGVGAEGTYLKIVEPELILEPEWQGPDLLPSDL